MKTTHDVAVALAVLAIAFFLFGFVATIVLLVNALLPPITMPPETVAQYLLYITIFEAMSALPCTFISFGIKMSE